MKKKVAIIGGGITGLSTAYFLKEKSKEQGIDIDCTLIESGNRWGGKIITDRVSDFIIEGGPDSFLSQKPWGIALCRKLGLLDQVVQTDPVHKAVYIVSGGTLKKFPDGMNLMIPGRITPFLLTSLISWSGKARMGLDLLIPRRSPQNEGEDESIAAFVRRRLGSEAVATFAEPILATIYAGDVEQLSLAATFPQLAGLEREFGSLIFGVWMKKWDAQLSRKRKSREGKNKTHFPPPAVPLTLFVTLKNGLESLVTALEKQLEGVVHMRRGQAVLEILPQEKGYVIVLPNDKLPVDAVVVTTDTHTAARFITPWNNQLASHLAAIPYVSTATVSLGFQKKDVTHPLNGFGFVIPRTERKSILAATWSSTKFKGRADASDVLIRTFVGGAHQEEIVDLPEDQLISTICDELTPLLGITATPIVHRVFRWKKGNPQYNVGHLDRIAQIEKETEKHPGLFLAGAAYKGVGIPDCIEQGWNRSDQVVRFLAGLS